MHRSLLLLALLAAVSTAEAESFVTLVWPRVNFVPRSSLQAVCRVSKAVQGCTFMTATMMTSCQASGSGFRLVPKVRLAPVAFIVNQNLLSHEMEHVADVFALLKSHSRRLAEPVHETPQSCQASGRDASASFSRQMRSFQRISSRRRDRNETHVVADAHVEEPIRALRGD